MKNYRSLIVLLLASVFLGSGCESSSTSTYTPTTGRYNFSDSYKKSAPEPENPYSPGSGHYAGFEWGERTGRTCGGKSASFIEGCEEYQRRQAAYEDGN